MADTDTLTKQFVKDKEVFADAFNYFLYDGKEVIKPKPVQMSRTFFDRNRAFSNSCKPFIKIH